MDFDITKVSIDGSVDDLSEEQLRELVNKFQDAQDSNVAEFEKAAEAAGDIDESTIEDFEQAKQGLIDDITSSEDFEEVPLSESALEDSDFSELREWKSFVLGVEDEDDTPEGGEDFDDMGKKSPKNTDEDGDPDFVEEQLGDMPGLQL